MSLLLTSGGIDADLLVKCIRTLQLGIPVDASRLFVNLEEWISMLCISCCDDGRVGRVDTEQLLEQGSVEKLKVEKDRLLFVPGLGIALTGIDGLAEGPTCFYFHPPHFFHRVALEGLSTSTAPEALDNVDEKSCTLLLSLAGREKITLADKNSPFS
jgi:hypothetical protein